MERHDYYADIMEMYPIFLATYPSIKLVTVLEKRYGVKDCRLMTVEQVRDLRDYMKATLRK